MLAREPMTGIFRDRAGNVVELMALPENLTPELVLALVKPHPDFALSLKPRGDYSAADLEAWRRSTVEGFEVFESGKLPPGWRHL
jgi:hypothetical protein